MAKYPYFDALETLGTLAVRAVHLASRDGMKKRKDDPEDLRRSCHKTLCELEDALFSDFLPPLERDDLATLAHALVRVTERAIELCLPARSTALPRTDGTEAEICLRLSEQLAHDLGILKKIRNPREMPALRAFRDLLAEGSRAHAATIEKCAGGGMSRALTDTAARWRKLRIELARTYDTLVEVMLNNI